VKHRQFMRQMKTWVQDQGTLRYLNEMVRMRCTVDMLELRLFPDMKEVTESYAAYAAVRDHCGLALSDPSVTVLAVGDGHTPRTAATFAFRSAWRCFSIDPRITLRDWSSIQRLTVLRSLVEDVPPIQCDGPAVIVAVHSHAPLRAAYEAVRAPEIYVVAIPCCVPQKLWRKPDMAYDDPGIWSPKRAVHVWLDRSHRRGSNPRPSGYEPDELPLLHGAEAVYTEAGTPIGASTTGGDHA
jgi:hypothetical protein